MKNTKKIGFLNIIKIILIALVIVSCNGFGEPKIVDGYEIYNNSNDTVDLIEHTLSKKLSDDLIFNYTKPFIVYKNGAKQINERFYLAPHSSTIIQLPAYWQKYVNDNKIGVVILNKDSVDKARRDSTFKEGLVKRCVIEFIQMNIDSLKSNNWKFIYKK